jgi:hypothetical protein
MKNLRKLNGAAMAAGLLISTGILFSECVAVAAGASASPVEIKKSLQVVYNYMDDQIERHNTPEVLKYLSPKYASSDKKGSRGGIDDARLILNQFAEYKTDLNLKSHVDKVQVNEGKVVADVTEKQLVFITDPRTGIGGSVTSTVKARDTWTVVNGQWVKLKAYIDSSTSKTFGPVKAMRAMHF